MAPPTLKVLLIEDDALLVQSLKFLLNGQRIVGYPTLGDFLQDEDAQGEFDVVLLDLCHPRDPSGAESLGLIPKLKARLPLAELVIQSGLGDVALMRRCIKLGAGRYLLKEHLADELPLVVAQIVEGRLSRADVDRSLVGDSACMQELKRQLLTLKSQTQLGVLIEGETGTGKEICARALHGEGPFVAVNVSAIPHELFEAEVFGAEKGSYTGSSNLRIGYLETARDGVLFLDEIQSLDLGLQAKLLRVLETRKFMRVGSSVERPFEARVIAASNQSLRERISKGSFREDLYFRLVQAKLSLPPLRLRESDVVQLATNFLSSFDTNGKIAFTEEAKEWMMQGYDWPGNVRELRSVVQRAVVNTKMPFIDREELSELVAEDERDLSRGLQIPGASPQGSFAVDHMLGFDENVAAFEKLLLTQALGELGSGAARERLKLSRTRFYEKLKSYKIQTT